MNAAHLHLLINHVPVLGTVFGLILLGVALLRRSPELLRASLVAFVLTGIAAAVAYLTGEPAEGRIEDLAGVSEALIGRHEDAAVVSLVGASILGLVSVAGLVRLRLATLPKWFNAAALAVALFTAGSMAWTANLGGQIRHPEIRSGAVAAAGQQGGEMETERD